MGDADIRRSNLRRYIRELFKGNQSRAASKLGKNPSYINDLLRDAPGKKKKSFGERAARDIERKLSLPRLALDAQLTDRRPDLVSIPMQGGWPFTFPRSRFDQLSPDQQKEIQGAVWHMILSYEAGSRPAKRKVPTPDNVIVLDEYRPRRHEREPSST